MSVGTLVNAIITERERIMFSKEKFVSILGMSKQKTLHHVFRRETYLYVIFAARERIDYIVKREVCYNVKSAETEIFTSCFQKKDLS